MSRKQNKQRNMAVLESEFKRAKFLKRDSSVGLFMLEDKTKIRLHQDVITGSLSTIDKGSIFEIPTSLINDASIVGNQRCIVSNPKQGKTPKVINPLFGQRMSEHCMYEQVFITEAHDHKTYGIPIGVKYYWLGSNDVPTVGSCVMISDWNTDTHTLVLIKKISEYFKDLLYGIALSINGEVVKNNVGALEDSELESFSIKRCMFTLLLNKTEQQMGPTYAIKMLK